MTDQTTLPCGCVVSGGVAVYECEEACQIRRLVAQSEARYFTALAEGPRRDVRGRAIAVRVARQMYREHLMQGYANLVSEEAV